MGRRLSVPWGVLRRCGVLWILGAPWRCDRWGRREMERRTWKTALGEVLGCYQREKEVAIRKRGFYLGVDFQRGFLWHILARGVMVI